jgi:SET domain-containing protein
MLLIKTFIGPSPIDGMGLFAGEDIPKGQIVWELNKSIDRIYTQEDLLQFHPIALAFAKKYWCFWKGLVLAPGDDARFLNHSENPNMKDLSIGFEDGTVAARDIVMGEELTSDYRNYDEDCLAHNSYK